MPTPQSRPQRPNKITDRLKGIWMVYTILALIGGVMVLAIWRREGELSQAVPVALGLLFGLSMPWTLRAHRYVAIQWLNVRATYSFWSIRYALATVVVGALVGVFFTDLQDKGVADSPQAEHAIKAALYGLVTGAILFALMLQGRTTFRSGYVNTWLRRLAAVSAGLTGWSWLASVTENDPWPALIAVAPIVGLVAVPGAIYHLCITYLGRPSYREDEN